MGLESRYLSYGVVILKFLFCYFELFLIVCSVGDKKFLELIFSSYDQSFAHGIFTQRTPRQVPRTRQKLQVENHECRD